MSIIRGEERRGEERRGEERVNLPARKSLMGIDSPLTGAPSMISYFATVSVSVVVLGPEKGGHRLH